MEYKEYGWTHGSTPTLRYLLLMFALVGISCKGGGDTTQPDASGLISPKATAETRALYRNMKQLSETKIMFGHHDANAYGHSWTGERGRTDVKDVCGSHPAVYGCDFLDLTKENSPEQQKQIEADLRTRVREVYLRGGINTVTWHFVNPVTEKTFYWEQTDSIQPVPRILPGGSHHAHYKGKLATIARFANSVKGYDGELIPLIFRPYHEYDGDWFWWGVPSHCTKEEFVDLWRFTVSYLRDTLGVQNFIYAISPDCRFNTKEEFLAYYPGDEYVDMIGMDNYWDLRPDGGTLADFEKKIKIVSDVAKEKGKLCALTETGLEGIPDAKWWTGTLLPLLKKPGLQLSYVMVWRNAYDSPTHFYAPFPGHPSCDDFIDFRKDKYTIFEDDLTRMYQ